MNLGSNPGTTCYCVTLYNRSTSLSLSFLREVTAPHKVMDQMRQNVDDFSPSIQVQAEVALITFLGLGPRSELERWQKVGIGRYGHHTIVLSLISYFLPLGGC